MTLEPTEARDLTTLPDHNAGATTVLHDLGEIIAAAQVALLEGRLHDLQSCLLRQRELCAKLGTMLENRRSFAEGCCHENYAAAANLCWQQNRVFAAILGQMKLHLEMLRNASRSPSLLYEAPSTELKL